MIAIRQARLPDDRPALIAFIDGLQRYEAEFESDRRLDAAYAEDQFAHLMKKADAVFVAESGATPVGWVTVYADDAPPYVIEAERRCAYISELYVEASARGRGVGRALIGACEDWAKAQGLRVIQIGHLSANARASRVYEEAGYSPYVLLRRKRL